MLSAANANNTASTHIQNPVAHLLHFRGRVDQLHVHALLLDVHDFGEDGPLLAVGHVDDGGGGGQEVHGGGALNRRAAHSHQHQQLRVSGKNQTITPITTAISHVPSHHIWTFFPFYLLKKRGTSQNTGLSSRGTPFSKCLSISSSLLESLVTASQTLRRLAEECLSAAHIQEKVNGDKSAAHYIQEKVNGDCFCECCLHCDCVRWFIHTSLLISVRVTVGPRTCVSGDIYFSMSEYM